MWKQDRTTGVGCLSESLCALALHPCVRGAIRMRPYLRDFIRTPNLNFGVLVLAEGAWKALSFSPYAWAYYVINARSMVWSS